jgi:hypothetical protein
MNNLEQLWVRACKLPTHERVNARLESIARRFYLVDTKVAARNLIINNLIDLCEKYNLITIRKLIRELDPDGYHTMMFPLDKKPPYVTLVYDAMVSAIRLARSDAFDGLTAPVYFRNRSK